MAKKNNFSTQKLQIGVWKNEESYECVWFDEKSQPHSCTLTSPISLVQLNTLIMPQPHRHSLKAMKFITAIAPQHTWTKTVLLPQCLNAAECEQQCQFLLSQELPLPLDDIWFDYQSESLKQGFKLSIFAIKKHTAQDYVNTYTPFPIQVLDCVTHAIIRAFQYFIGFNEDENILLLYQDKQYGFAIQPTAHPTQFIQQTGKNLTALADAFCQRHSFQPERVYFYHDDLLTQTVPPHWQQVETDLPLIALGNALWQQSF